MNKSRCEWMSFVVPEENVLISGFIVLVQRDIFLFSYANKKWQTHVLSW